MKEVYLYFRTQATLADDDASTDSGVFLLSKLRGMHPTSDTALTHLAGALGIKAWLPLKFVPDWRWMLDRDDSPWYPNHRLFRQPNRDDWVSVFEQMEKELLTMSFNKANSSS